MKTFQLSSQVAKVKKNIWKIHTPIITLKNYSYLPSRLQIKFIMISTIKMFWMLSGGNTLKSIVEIYIAKQSISGLNLFRKA